MGDFFNVTMKGEETLITDLNAFLFTLKEPIRSGLNSVADGFSNSLDKHIQHDVYDAYNPKRYPRRQMKDSLMSPDYKEISVHDLSLRFQYEPKGFHKAKMKDMLGAEWDDMIHRYVVLDKETGATKDIIENPNDPLKPKPVHGDRLIERIQTGEGYDWQPPKGEDSFPKRPFWNNFVEEQRSGAALDSFVYGFGTGVTKLQLEGGSRDLEWNGDEGMIGSSFIGDEDDYELPW